MLLSFLFPFVVSGSGASSAVAYEANLARTIFIPECFLALVLISTSAPAMFHTVSRLAVWTRALTVLLNLPLVLFLSFLVGYSMSGGSPDGAAAIKQEGGELVGPGLALLWFGVLLSVIGCVISFIIWLIIAAIEKKRQAKQPEQSQRG